MIVPRCTEFNMMTRSDILSCKCAFIKATKYNNNDRILFRVLSLFLFLTLMVPDEGVSVPSFASSAQTGAASSFCGHLVCVCCNCWCFSKWASSVCLTQKLPTSITELIHHFQSMEAAASATKDSFFFPPFGLSLIFSQYPEESFCVIGQRKLGGFVMIWETVLPETLLRWWPSKWSGPQATNQLLL